MLLLFFSFIYVEYSIFILLSFLFLHSIATFYQEACGVYGVFFHLVMMVSIRNTNDGNRFENLRGEDGPFRGDGILAL